MANQRLDIRQSQSLSMTPQLQQAIKMLQLSNLELTDFLVEELEKNPLLEKMENMSEAELEAERKSRAEVEHDQEQVNSDLAQVHEDDQRSTEDSIEISDVLESDVDNLFTGNAEQEQGGADLPDYAAGDPYAKNGKGGNLNFENPEFSLENTLSEKPSLREHLLGQLQLTFTDNKDLMIGMLLIDRLDQSGYLRVELDRLADRLGCEMADVKRVLNDVQQFDPTGIFARNLGECLGLQLQEKNRLDPAMQKLLDNLDVLATRDLEALKEICAVDDEDLTEMICEIKALDPKPALEFDHFISQTLVPDVFMKALPKKDGGGWGVELNMDTLPRVLVNRVYYAEVRENVQDKEAKQYLKSQMDQASFLVKAMDQRAQTILKVSSEIIRRQEAFFAYGVEYLKPLTLRDIAEKIEMHESTVSRVTTNKYIGTPRGAFELKYFFSSSISGTDGGDLSSEAVKARIKTLIDNEDPAKILSDDAIVTALKNDSVDIARRTVAKYREALRIPSSVQRRKEKKHLLLKK